MKKRRTAARPATALLALCGIVPLLALASACGVKANGTTTVGIAAGAATTPSPTPAPPAPTATTAPPSTPPADPGITIEQLTAAPVDIPQWNGYGPDICPRGRIRLVPTDRLGDSNDGTIRVRSVAHANLDRDPAVETVAMVRCQTGEAAISQAVVFERDPRGAIVTVGSVVQGYLWKVGAGAGRVTVDISDMMACCDTPKLWEVHQTRSYAWDGSRFRQVAGPTAFSSHPHPTDLRLTLVSVSWQPLQGGHRSGTMTVRVHNAGPYLSDPYLLEAHGGEWDPDPTRYPPLAVGASRSVAVTIRDAYPGNDAQVTVYELGTGGNVEQDQYVRVTVPV